LIAFSLLTGPSTWPLLQGHRHRIFDSRFIPPQKLDESFQPSEREIDVGCEWITMRRTAGA